VQQISSSTLWNCKSGWIHRSTQRAWSAGAVALLLCPALWAAAYPNPVEGDYVVKDFKFVTGETLPELKLHYATIGAPSHDAVLIMHGTGGSSRQFLSEGFGGELFGPGQLLDATKHYIILTDAIGHGESSKPSDGLHLRFPRYTYEDMVRAQYRVITGKLGVRHMRLVMGTSMGAMHTWMWGYMYPDFMDALMPLASAPVEIGGRNRMLRKMIMDSIRNDPEFNNGEYTGPLKSMLAAQFALFIMTSSPLQLYKQAPTREQADQAFDRRFYEQPRRQDPNDMLYAYDSSRDYNPAPRLEEIRALLYAINSADDEVNPPELGILEREIKRVKHGRFILIPTSEKTRGHGTHSIPGIWGEYLAQLLQESQLPGPEERAAALRNPKHALWSRPAPEVYRVRIDTARGSFTLEITRALAPRGADRFYHLVETGFYDDSRFYRVISGRFAQFGIPGEPAIAAIWRNERFPDDPVKASNVRGSFAFAMTGPGARTTQIYINTSDQSRQDASGFAPFGRVVEGMEVVDNLYAGYGESSGGGMRAGRQGKLFEEGDAYLDREFPLLEKLLRARIVAER
jgi:homoserine O-acetyltransferase